MVLLRFITPLIILSLCSVMPAQVVFDESINQLAQGLVDTQIVNVNADDYGGWPDEEWATGAITLGMISAFQRTGVEEYRTVVHRAGINIVSNAYVDPYVFYGDSAYALVKIEEDLSNNWLSSLESYYELIETTGTRIYLQDYDNYDNSMAAYYLAHHVLSVYSLDRADKQIWRNKLIQNLGQTDDESHFPVMALALSIWALAETGSLDNTLVDPNANDSNYWYQKQLKDLPALLMSHKVPSGLADAGCYFWKFNHMGGPEDAIVRSGYTEDVVFGTLACLSLYAQASDVNLVNTNDDPSDDVSVEGTWMEQMNPSFTELEQSLIEAETILIGAIHEDGSVCAHVLLGGDEYYTFAGEVLHALCLLDCYEETRLGLK